MGSDQDEITLRLTGAPVPGGFPPTRWSLVSRATARGDTGSFEALSQLCQLYWYPLYAFVRGQGTSHADACDEIQGFFAVLLEMDFLAAANPERGRLRTFLLTALTRYRAKEYRGRLAKKRGGGSLHVSIDATWAEGRFGGETVDTLSPEQILDRSWARLMVDQSIAQLAAEFSVKGKGEEFEVFSQFLDRNSDGMTYAAAATQMGISEANLKVRVHRMRRRLRTVLEDNVRQTLGVATGELQEELRHLRALLG